MSSSLCPNGGGPPMNTDISGPGVRVSFYLQTLFLSCLSARSNSLEEITGALYTLLFTNTAMAVTALILGFKPNPEISFHDALVVFYLLHLSWVTVFFSLPACARFPGSVKLLHFCSIVQSYTVFAFSFAMLITAKSFGIPEECNPNAVVVIFRPFKALTSGRIVFFVVTVLIAVFYTGMLVKDHIPARAAELRRWIQQRVTRRVPATDTDEEQPPLPMVAPDIPPLPFQRPGVRVSRPGNQQHRAQQQQRQTHEQPAYDLQIAWNLVIELGVVLVLWGLAVMNTELLIRWNHFDPSGSAQSSWQFGQVLPMFLVVLPLANVINAFMDLGLRPVPQATPVLLAAKGE